MAFMAMRKNLDERARTQRDIEALLHDLYILMSKTNIISVVAIGLMVSWSLSSDFDQ